MEIELRAFIDDVGKVEKRITELGGKFLKKVMLVDSYFCDKDRKKVGEVLQCKAGDYSLRLRRTKFNGQEKVELNSKVLEKEGDHNAFHEHETELTNFEEAEKIMDILGKKKFCEMKKERLIYELGKIEINIEKIEGFRDAIELEIIDDDAEGSMRELKKLMADLGIKELIPKSITYEYMLEKSFF